MIMMSLLNILNAVTCSALILFRFILHAVVCINQFPVDFFFFNESKQVLHFVLHDFLLNAAITSYTLVKVLHYFILLRAPLLITGLGHPCSECHCFCSKSSHSNAKNKELQ